MEVSGPHSLTVLLLVVFAISLTLDFVFAWFVLGAGALVVFAATAGRVRCGSARLRREAPADADAGRFCYRQGDRQYMYKVYVHLIGLLVVLAALTAVGGVALSTRG